MESSSPAPRRRVFGAVVALLGFILSPLTWWNDAFVNLPLAFGAAYLVGLVRREWYEPAIYIAYLGTNVLGFVLMHLGVRMGVTKSEPFTYKDLAKQFLVALAYTTLVFALMRLGYIPKMIQP
jgi:hypothetical protein